MCNSILPAETLNPGNNRLLCAEANETIRFVNEIANPRAGILFDTAQLKMTANTLGFDLVPEAKKALTVTRCVHHSDNDGLQDNNKPFVSDYWFIPLMKEAVNAVHVLQVRKQTPEELKEMERLLFA